MNVGSTTSHPQSPHVRGAVPSGSVQLGQGVGHVEAEGIQVVNEDHALATQEI